MCNELNTNGLTATPLLAQPKKRNGEIHEIIQESELYKTLNALFHTRTVYK